MNTEKKLKDLQTLLVATLTFAIFSVLFGVMAIFQNSQISFDSFAQASGQGRDIGLLQGKRECEEALRNLVPIGEAPEIVKDENGNEYATDGFTYVIIQQQ